METKPEDSRNSIVVETTNTPTQELLDPLPSGRQPVAPAPHIRTSGDACESNELESQLSLVENNETAVTDAIAIEEYPYTNDNLRGIGEELRKEECGGVYEINEDGPRVYIFKILQSAFCVLCSRGSLFEQTLSW